MSDKPARKPKPKSIVRRVSTGEGGGSSPPSYEMIEAQREIIETSLQMGLSVERLMEAFGIASTATFYAMLKRDPDMYQRVEIGRSKANAKVSKTLFERATKDKDVGACIWWEKTRSNMRERNLTMTEVKDWILNLPYNLRAKLFADLGISQELLHGTGLVIDSAPGNQLPQIVVNFVRSPHSQEGGGAT